MRHRPGRELCAGPPRAGGRSKRGDANRITGPSSGPSKLGPYAATRAIDNDRRWVAPANFLDFREQAQSFQTLAAYDRYSVNLTGGDRPERLRAASVSGNFFSTLGATPAIGRVFTPNDDAVQARRTAVLSHGLWQRRFGGTAAVLGRDVTIDGQPHTIVGVMPASFTLLGTDLDIYTSADRGVPRTFPFPGDVTMVRDSHIIYVVGRLNRGVTVQQANAEAITMARQLERTYPATNTGLGARVVGLHDDVVAAAAPSLWLLGGAVAVLLLIACANVANLLLGRAVTRQREMAIRVALGAGRGRLVRQMLTETATLSVAGGILAVVLSQWTVPALLALSPDVVPRAAEIRIDAIAWLFTLLVSLVTAAIFGLVPALQATRTSVPGAMAVDGVRAGSGPRQRRMHQALVVSELALAQILLAGAALLVASLMNVSRVDLGFVPEKLLAVELTMPPGKYADPARKLAFNRAIFERLEALPGVKSAAATLTVPLRGAINRGFRVDRRPAPPPGQEPNVDFMIVSPEYFRTLGIPIVSGRAFTEQDAPGAPRVAMVSRAMAAKYWPGEDAIGKAVRFGRGDEPWDIVGIVGDVRQRDPERAPEPLLYISYLQDVEPWNFIAFALRTDGDPASLASAARSAVLSVDPEQPVSRIRTIEEIAGTLGATRRFHTTLLASLAGLALVLAVIGTYGVMAYGVTRRTREIGVRMALGARPGDVLRLVLGQGALLIVTALAIGVAAALMTNRLLAHQLFDVTPTDPWVLGCGTLALAASALLACYLPARRAMRVEPVAAMQQ